VYTQGWKNSPKIWENLGFQSLKKTLRNLKSPFRSLLFAVKFITYRILFNILIVIFDYFILLLVYGSYWVVIFVHGVHWTLNKKT